MSLIYPPLIPNFFGDLELPDYKIMVFTNDDGSERRRILHTTGNHTKVKLKYEGRTEVEVGTLVNFYTAAQGLQETFTLDSSIIRHPAAYQAGLAALGSTTLWRFESPPSITTVYVGIYNFDVALISVII